MIFLIKTFFRSLYRVTATFLVGGMPAVLALINDLREENKRLTAEIEQLKKENDDYGY